MKALRVENGLLWEKKAMVIQQQLATTQNYQKNI